MAPYVTAEELEQALGPSTYAAIFNDSGEEGEINETAVDLVLRAAHADVLRYIVRGYDSDLPDPPPEEVWALELDFAKARAYMRGDAYTRDTGERLLKDARETAKAIAEGLQRGGEKMGNPTGALSPILASPGAAGASIVAFEDTTGGADCPTERCFWRRERC